MPRERISACFIVQDEEERLPEALASVAFCDEIIVVDGGSRDRTCELARAAGAKVIENPWPGFAKQRNVSIDAATGDWILEIDADERIAPELRRNIEQLLEQEPRSPADMVVFALRNRFLGGTLGPSAKYPSYRSRLFRRGRYRHDEGRVVHEGLELRERPLILGGDLEHELAASLREALVDMWRYASLDSKHIPAPSSPLGYVKGIVLRPVAKFFYRMIVDGGWRDGWRGLLKISLDVCSDMLVWILVWRHGGAPAQSDVSLVDDGAEHFGRRRVGPVKIVMVAGSPSGARAAAERLSQLARDGADVALIAPSSPPGFDLPVQEIGRAGPLSVVRALEAEMHVRPIDVVQACDLPGRLALRLVPASLRPAMDLDGVELRGS